jgi:ABC-type transporter Mla subunit MlaD
MASENGLDIQQIQRQWEDSQKTLSDLRARLQTLVSASESAQMSTDSIKSAETSLAKLAEQNQESTKYIAEAVNQALTLIQSMQEIATKSDFGTISESLKNLQAKQTVLDSVQTAVTGQKAPIEEITQRTVKIEESMSALTKAVKHLTKQVEDLGTQQSTSTETREELLAKIRAAVAELPSRQQGKFTNLIA